MPTSSIHSTPFPQSYWVIPGKLLAGQVPTSYYLDKTKVFLENLKDAGVNTIINLMEENEKNHYGDSFFDYANYLNIEPVWFPVETYRFPIKDVSVPKVKLMKMILDRTDSSVSEGKCVYIHCWGGIGRTGTVVGCYLMRHGYATQENVIEKIDKLKMNSGLSHVYSPETKTQVEFVLNWKYGK